MSVKKSRPIIGKLAGTWSSGNKTGFTDPATSPTSPLELKIQSPRGLKNYYDLGGVGLGIVAALEKSGDSGCQILAKNPVFVRNLSRNSDPIPVKLPGNTNCGGYRRGLEEMGLDYESDENYTFVTCHGPNRTYRTRVYCDNGGERIGFDRREKNNGCVPVFEISPARLSEDIGKFPSLIFSVHVICARRSSMAKIFTCIGERKHFVAQSVDTGK